MTLLIAVFICMLITSFGVLALIMRQAPDQTALGHRLATLVSAQSAPETNVDMLLLRSTSQGSAFGWLDDLMEGSRFFAAVGILLRQAGSSLSVSRLILLCGVSGAGAFFLSYVLVSQVAVATGVGACLAFAPVLYLRTRRKQRVAAFDGALSDAIELCARSLRAGHSLIGAIGNVAEQGPEPVKSEFAEVFRLQNFGLPLRDALTQLMDRIPSSDLRVVVTGILVQKDTGGNLAEIMDHITEVIRERTRIKGDIQVHTAQGRLTGWILCLLPMVLLGAVNLMTPGYSNVLFRDPAGQKLLYASVALLVIGGLIIRHIIHAIEV